MSGANWAYSDPASAAKTAPGEFRLADDETRAWDAYAAAVLSNLTDRTMGHDVAAGFAATMADAMIMERRKRPRERGAFPRAPIQPPAEVMAATASPAALAASLAPVMRPDEALAGPPVLPVAAVAVPAPPAAAAGNATSGAVCECSHTTDTHVREALGVDRWLRCVVPGCSCAAFKTPAPVVAPAGAAGL